MFFKFKLNKKFTKFNLNTLVQIFYNNNYCKAIIIKINRNNTYNVLLINKNIKLYYINSNNISNYSEECSICFEELNHNYTILNCNHIFHTKCLNQYNKFNINNNNKCPLCNINRNTKLIIKPKKRSICNIL